MKQTFRYQSMMIPNKLKVEIRLVIDDTRNPEYTSNYNGDRNTSLVFYPIVSISLIKNETDESGQRIKQVYNPNDTAGMTRYNIPIFLDNLSGIRKDLNDPKMYTYTGKRLELNEAAANRIRRVFVIGNMTIELSAVVIQQADETRVEGIKMKFNNEQSTALLTLNEMEALIFNLSNMDVDSISMMMYFNYYKKPSGIQPDNSISKPVVEVDIVPLPNIVSMKDNDLPI